MQAWLGRRSLAGVDLMLSVEITALGIGVRGVWSSLGVAERKEGSPCVSLCEERVFL